MTDERFELWVDPAWGDYYEVRYVAGRLAGVCGPVSAEAVAHLDLPGCRFRDLQRDGRTPRLPPLQLVRAERWVLSLQGRAEILGALARAAPRGPWLGGAARPPRWRPRPDEPP